MDGTKFFEVAEKVIELEEGEAYYRTAVSRAYYGLFLSIRDDIDYIEWPEAAETHAKMCQFLNQAGKNGADKRCDDVASELKDLRKQRNDADYGSQNDRSEYVVSKKQAKATLLNAKQIWQLYKDVRGQKLKQGIKSYLEKTRGIFEYWSDDS